ncbi:MAG: lipoate--protein ligase [Bacteroidales bacterium]
MKISENPQLLCIYNKSDDVYFNLALEEYLLKNFEQNIFMLWFNQPSVVVGKHQNTFAEINHKFIKQNNIKVARRLSGGGTVYHDTGNLNFTYIMNALPGKMVDFVKYTEDILEFLHKIGIPASKDKRNNLNINGLKISGNAEHLFRNRVLHHGTLLFNTDLQMLEEAIRVDPYKITDKAVKSIRSKVTNISNHLHENISFESFSLSLFNFMVGKNKHAEKFELSENQIIEINKLRNDKYSGWEWIYGYSPGFELMINLVKKDSISRLDFKIKNGIINSVEITEGLFSSQEIEILKTNLIGLKFTREVIVNQLKEFENELLSKGFTKEEFADYLF